MVRRDLLARVVPLGERLDDGLAVGRDRDGVLEACDRVADPDLDRAPLRVRADVPPDVGVVRDAPGALELADDPGVVVVVAEPRRRARSAGRPRRRSAGSTRAPSARPRQNGELAESASSGERCGQEPVDDLDRLVGVVDRDVDVHPEDQLAPRDVLELVDERVVAVLAR